MNTTMQMNGMQPGQPGAAMMMQPQVMNGAMGRPAEQVDDKIQQKARLNTAIYDYFLKMGEFDLARTLKNSSLDVQLADSHKRKAPDDDDSRGENEPQRPSDLPPASIPLHSLTSNTAFLLDWYSIFFDLFHSNTRTNDANKSTLTGQYLQHTQNMNRLHQQQQQNMLRQGMMPTNPVMLRNGMVLRNGAGMNQQQQQQMMAANRHRMAQQMQQANMAREGSGMDGDGNRPRTPSSGDTAPSPSKRQRVDGQPFAPGMMNGGGMPGQMGDPNTMHQQRAQSMLLANGINPTGMTQQQMATFGAQNPQVQNKTLQLYKQGMTAAHTAQRANMAGQGSPNLINPGMEMQQAMQGGNGDFYNNNNINRPGVNGQNGHALQDYQMQLMLLERQNRKRLEMAKQEQEVGGVPGQNGQMGPMQFAPNMSPSGSRPGASPNPSEQMKRDGGPRASPSAMNYSQMQGIEGGIRNGANGMQPPSSHPGFQNGAPAGMSLQQMQAMRGPQGGPMPGQPGFQPGQQGPMGAGNQQPGPNGQMGTPRQQNAAMPPPQGVPPSNQNATGRAPSPAPSAAAVTPQIANKPNNKKKDNAKKERKPSTKKTNNAAATPAENADAPATSQPATPITPAMANGAAFEKNNKASANGPNGNANVQSNGVPPAPAAQQPSQPAAPTDSMHDAGDMGMSDFGTDLNFATMEAGDVLDQFNFDAFIDDGSGNLDNFNFDMGGFDNNMETGIGNEA